VSKTTDRKKLRTLSAELVAKSKGTMILPSEILNSLERLAPEAVATLESLMRDSKSDTVRLRAAIEVLGLAGITKETKISIKTDVQDLDDTGLDSRLTELLGKAAETLHSLTSPKIKDIEGEVIHIQETTNERSQAIP